MKTGVFIDWRESSLDSAGTLLRIPKPTRISQLAFICEREVHRALILKTHVHFPNFRAEESLFYPEDGGTTSFFLEIQTNLYQTAQSNAAADCCVQ